MMSEPVLLLGNGINLATATPNWRSLVFNLSLLIEDEDARSELLRVGPGSLSLLVEGLVSRSRLSEREVRNKIAQFFSDGVSSIFRNLAARSDIHHILTTNYDRNIETSLRQVDPNVGRITNSSSKSESKYNLYRRNRVADRDIWHIHGDVNSPGSIQLGFEHYTGQLEKIIAYRNQNRDRLRAPSDKISPEAWIEAFIWGDTHIIGLGLAEDEIDIWWAIQYWARHRERSGFGPITFYSTDGTNSATASRRDSLLRGFGVHVVHADENLLAANAYEKVFADWLNRVGVGIA